MKTSTIPAGRAKAAAAATGEKSVTPKPAGTKATRKKPPVSEVLASISVAEAATELRRLDATHAVIPMGFHNTLENKISRLQEVAEIAGFTVRDLIVRQALVLETLTGAPKGTVSHSHHSTLAEELHIHRNLMVAIAALAAATIEVESKYCSPKTVYAHAIKLAKRGTGWRRPFTYDEILLCRVAAYLASQADPTSRPAGIYCQVEAGLTPGETAQVTLRDFDDHQHPGLIDAPGNGHIASRLLPLDQLESHILGRYLETTIHEEKLRLHKLDSLGRFEADLAGDLETDARSSTAEARRVGPTMDNLKTRTLFYTPRPSRHTKRPVIDEPHWKRAAKATASVQQVLDRFLAELKLDGADTTAYSITLWRIKSVLEAHGVAAAHTISGRTEPAQMYQTLELTKPQEQEPDNSFDDFASNVANNLEDELWGDSAA